MNFYEWFFLEKDREPAGMFSFGHIFSVTLTLAILIVLAIFLGKKFRGNEKKTNLVLMIAGIAIVVLEVAKIGYQMIGSDNIGETIIGNAPLYFCDIMIFMIPLAAFTKGRFRDCCLDFVAVCGLLMGFMGNYFAGNLYPYHAIISWSAIVALLNHSISAFASMFVWVARLNKMEKRNVPYVIGMLFIFMTIALIVDYLYIPFTGQPHNFMFFFYGDGTPFTFFHDLVGGNKILYQMIVYILQCGYIGLFYVVYYAAMKCASKRQQEKELNTESV